MADEERITAFVEDDKIKFHPASVAHSGRLFLALAPPLGDTLPMPSILDWSITAADNDDADSGINWLELQAPATVNNSARGMMARIAQWIHAITGEKVSGGSANAHTLTTGLGWSALEPMILAFKAGYTNTGATTLNVDGLGVIDVETPAGAALTAGAITTGGVYLVAYEAATPRWVLLGERAAVTRDSLGLDTDDSPLFAGVSIGNADTTITRTSAGNIEVEGDPVLTATDIGSSVQGYDADLAAIAALSTQAYGRGVLVLADEAAFKAAVNLEAGTDFPPIPTSSTLPVGFTGTMRYTSSSSLADGDTTAGSNVRTVAFTGDFGSLGLNVASGKAQSGTWRNDNGTTLRRISSDNDGEQIGLMTRIA